MTASAPAAALARQRDRTTRRPSGKPSWPILLLAGGEKSGKSWSCAEASGSDLIGRTLWIGIGEDDPDEYGNVPGANFEIVTHDGTYRDILAAIEWATHQPTVDGKPTLIVLDSMTRLWDLLCEMAQTTARERIKRKASNSRQSAPADDEVQITMDLWNTAKDRWGHIVGLLRSHQGPSLVTARLEDVVVVVNGKPTQDRTLKVKAEKSLPYDVGGIVQMPERGRAYLTGVRTTRMQIPERVPFPGFTVDKLWRQLGLADVEVGERRHSGITAATPGDVVRAVPDADERLSLIKAVAAAAEQAGAADGMTSAQAKEAVVKRWAEEHGGEHINNATDLGSLELLRDELMLRASGAVSAA